MKNLFFFAVLFLLLLVVTAFRICYIYKLNMQNAENKILSIQEENNNFKKVIGFMYQNDGKKLSDKICIDENGNKKLLSEFCNIDTSTLIFNFSSLDCSNCINEVMNELSLSNIGNLLVVSDFNNISSMRYLKNKYSLKGAVFLKLDNNIGFPETPSLFLTNKNLIIRKFLIINRNDVILMPYLKQL